MARRIQTANARKATTSTPATTAKRRAVRAEAARATRDRSSAFETLKRAFIADFNRLYQPFEGTVRTLQRRLSAIVDRRRAQIRDLSAQLKAMRANLSRS
jgi:hypothetical protein